MEDRNRSDLDNRNFKMGVNKNEKDKMSKK